MTNDFSVIPLKYISYDPINKSIKLFGFPVTDLQDFFKKPIQSSSLQIFSSRLNLAPLKMFNLTDVKCKMVKIDTESSYSVFMPLLHTLQFVAEGRDFNIIT